MKTKTHTSKNIFQSVLFITVLFFYFSCSNDPATSSGQAKQEKQDTISPPRITVLITLADSSKPKEIFLEKTPKPQTIAIPKVAGTSYTMQTTSGPKKIELSPAITTPLAVLKNKKGEVIKDNDGNSFILGEAGGASNFSNYTTDQGLALDAIACGFRDKTGNLWFGTQGGGVSRYDGKSFMNFTTAQGLANNTVWSITEDKTGNLWFGTLGGGVSCYDGISFTNFTTAQGLANNTVRNIMEDKTGNLWFGTEGGGVSCYDGNRVEAIEAALQRGEIISQRTQQDLKKINGKLVKSFTNFTMAQGLANNNVWSITEDKTGNLWFGTYGGGVSRYNPSAKLRTGSESFTNFTMAQGLANNLVTSITEDKTGNLWFGTYGGGVSRYDPSAKLRTGSESFTNFTMAEGLANNTVLSITEDKMGNLWFGSSGKGVSRYDGNRVEAIEAALLRGEVIPQRTQQDLKKINGKLVKSFTNFTMAQGLAHNIVWSITEDKTGNLWFGTQGGGVSLYDGKSFTNFTTAQGLANNTIWSITEDKTGNFWFGTQGGGVCRYDGKSFTNYTMSQGLAFNTVRSIMEDKTGNLWFGTDGEGVSRYDGNRVEAIEATLQKGETTPQRTQQDLKKINGKHVKSFTNFTTVQGLANNTVLSIMEDKIGNLWFGTQGGGVCRYDGNRVEAIEAALLRGEIIPQRTQQDLKKINEKLAKSFMNFTTTQGLANNTVWSITEDKTGNLWFGTDGGGVSCYDGISFTNFTSAQGLANNIVLSITEDKTGNLWFGTYGGGLSRYDGKSFMNITTAQGLPDNTVTQVVITKEQNIGIGTNLGVGVLISFAPKPKLKTDNIQNNIPAQNNMTNEELKNYIPVIGIYNSANGYPVKDVNAGQNCMFVDSKGIIWIATGADKTALVRFDYAALNKNKMPPDVFIQSVKINNSTISWYDLESSQSKVQSSKLEKTDSTTIPANITEEVTTFGKVLSDAERNSMNQKFRDIKFDGITKFYPVPENLVLPYSNNNVTLDFAAIEPAKPYLVNYQYILEGYDKEWSPITKKTSATFGNIYEGIYTFKLKAQSPFGVWSEPIEYKFTVLPPWWRTWWMYSVYGIAAIALVILIVWWNGRRLRAKAVELTEEVRKATVTIVEKSEKLGEALKDIKDSINYAERIQRSFLATTEMLDQRLKDYFVFFRPKDVVSGDFYWAGELNNGNFAFTVADSTGHGVPGAIMSILNISSLEKSIEKETEPDQILNATRKIIIERLKKDGSSDGGKDGMDCSLLVLKKDRTQLSFAAANNPVFIVRNNELIEFKPDKMPVGKHDKDTESFTLHTIPLQKGDVIYALTDGFPDQFGGEKGKKYMIKNLKILLLKISPLPMREQEQKLSDELTAWKGENEQVDDILIMGIRV